MPSNLNRRSPLTIVLLAALPVLALFLGPADQGVAPAAAGHAGGMNAMSIDLNSAGNGATSLGVRQACRQVFENNAQDAGEDVVDGILIDVTAAGIPAVNTNGTTTVADDSGGIVSFSYQLAYSDANLTVQAQNVSLLLAANGGSSIFNVSDTVPDGNGDNAFAATALDTGSALAEQGSGTLARLTLLTDAGASDGAYSLALSANVHIDAAGTGYTPDATNNATVVVGTIAGEPDPCGDADSDGVHNLADNCRDFANADQQNTDGDAQGDACDADDDNDGAADAADNCPTAANAEQTDTDGDGQGDACDADDDGDGASDADETAAGSDPLNAASTPEVCDGIDNDLNDGPDEGFLNTDGDEIADCADPDDDGDGYADTTEAHVGTQALEPCGQTNWPADIVSSGPSTDSLDLSDLASFILPVRYYDTDLGTNPGDSRWDVVPGSGLLTKDINIVDLANLAFLKPDMFNGERAFGGPDCSAP